MRVDRAVRAAAQFDVNMANRLRNGIVSDLDLMMAQQIYQNAQQSPAFGNPWDQGGGGWNQNVEAAQVLYQEVAAQHARQNPYVTQRETMMNYEDPTGASERGWGPQPQRPIFDPVLQSPVFNPTFDPGWPGTPPFVDPFPRGPVYDPRPVFIPNDFPGDYGRHRRHGHHGRGNDTLAVIAGVGIGLEVWAAVRSNQGYYR